MKEINHFTPKVGLISLTETNRTIQFGDERELAIIKKHNAYKDFLLENQIEVIDASDIIDDKKGSVAYNSSSGIKIAVDFLIGKHVEALVVGCWHWTEPMFIVEIARLANRPILLYSDEDTQWAATCLLTAAGASLWESSPNRPAHVHERIYGDKGASLKWIRGVCAVEKLKTEIAVLWGGSYALRMEYLQDDYPRLKSFLVGDIINEDQYVLIKKAESISKKRITAFRDWLIENNTKIKYDKVMLTPEVLEKQIALYLAAKDRIKEIEEKTGYIGGVSIKCFDEVADIYGIDPCFLPAFIPYSEDSEGPKRPVNTVCEGDIKGLLTMMMLTNISGGVPSLFGDLSYIGKDHFIISNCGASSIYYSCKNCSVKGNLSNLTIEANCEGISGGAVGYDCPPQEITYARLVRVKGRYFMLAGKSETIEITDRIRERFYYGRTWPHAAVRLNVDQQMFIKSLGANHLVAVPGDNIKELEHSCILSGIEMFRLDSEEGLKNWLNRVRFLQ